MLSENKIKMPDISLSEAQNWGFLATYSLFYLSQ